MHSMWTKHVTDKTHSKILDINSGSPCYKTYYYIGLINKKNEYKISGYD